tara:strand:- start:118471 stop:118806 length:336 start_codon:yes stop_codon:yes gene_type:complete
MRKIAGSFLAMLLILIEPTIAAASGFEDGHMFWGDGFSLGHMFFGGAMMIAFWGAIIFLIVLAVRWLSGSGTRPDSGTSNRNSSLKILEDRYAHGDIDHDEFESRRRKLME